MVIFFSCPKTHKISDLWVLHIFTGANKRSLEIAPKERKRNENTEIRNAEPYQPKINLIL